MSIYDKKVHLILKVSKFRRVVIRIFWEKSVYINKRARDGIRWQNKVIKGGIRIRHGLQISDCLTFGGLGL